MNTIRFSGAIPEYYEKYLGPILFEPYATDLVKKISNAPTHILELACGTGQLTRQIIEHIPAVKELCATDLNQAMLLAAGNKIKSPVIDWLVVDAKELPFENERFDLVICQFGIMFFDDRQEACNEVFRVLEAGGSFIFNTWDKFDENPGSRIVHQVLKTYFGNDAPDFMEAIPFSFYEEKEIKEMLHLSGFTKVTIEKIRKTSHIKNVDDVIQGFLKGTPLAYFLEKKKKVHNEAVYELIKKQLVSTYGTSDLAIPMQAIVCQATK